VVLRAISEITLKIAGVYDPDPFSGLVDAAQDVQYQIYKVQEKSLASDILQPPRIQIEARNSALIKVSILFTKLIENKRKSDATSKIFKDQSAPLEKLSKSKSDFSINAMVDELEEEAGWNLHGEVLLDLPSMWIELDSKVRRIVNTRVLKSIEQGVMCCNYPGRFCLTSEKLLWYGVPKNLEHHAKEIIEKKAWKLAVVIPFKNISQVIFNPISVTGFESHPQASALSKGYYMAIYTGFEVYRLFPFTAGQMQFMKEALEQLAKIKPAFQDYYVRKMLVTLANPE
jgi:hypothetical protein